MKSFATEVPQSHRIQCGRMDEDFLFFFRYNFDSFSHEVPSPFSRPRRRGRFCSFPFGPPQTERLSNLHLSLHLSCRVNSLASQNLFTCYPLFYPLGMRAQNSIHAFYENQFLVATMFIPRFYTMNIFKFPRSISVKNLREKS